MNPVISFFFDTLESGDEPAFTLSGRWLHLIDSGYDWADDGIEVSSESLSAAREFIATVHANS